MDYFLIKLNCSDTLGRHKGLLAFYSTIKYRSLFLLLRLWLFGWSVEDLTCWAISSIYCNWRAVLLQGMSWAVWINSIAHLITLGFSLPSLQISPFSTHSKFDTMLSCCLHFMPFVNRMAKSKILIRWLPKIVSESISSPAPKQVTVIGCYWSCIGFSVTNS